MPRPVCKPHSVQQGEAGLHRPKGISSPRPAWAIISLGGALPRRSSDLPGTGSLPLGGAHKETSRLLPSADGIVPAWPCSRRGLPGRPHYGGRRWSLTPPFHHDRPHPCGRGGCLFLWPSSGRLTPNEVSPPRVLSDAVLCGVRTFLDPVNTGPRSPDQPEAVSSYPLEGRASIGKLFKSYSGLPKLPYKSSLSAASSPPRTAA